MADDGTGLKKQREHYIRPIKKYLLTRLFVMIIQDTILNTNEIRCFELPDMILTGTNVLLLKLLSMQKEEICGYYLKPLQVDLILNNNKKYELKNCDMQPPFYTFHLEIGISLYTFHLELF